MISKTELEPIPVNFVCRHAIAQPEKMRKQLIDLISAWGKELGFEEEALELAREINSHKDHFDTQNMPPIFYPKFRQPAVAEKLVEVIRDIHIKISNGIEPWTWAQVMKVMRDEMIIMKITPNKFDDIISAMLPQKSGRIRKSGDYTILNEEDSWNIWSKSLNPEKAELRSKCNQIALQFNDLLDRTIYLDY